MDTKDIFILSLVLIPFAVAFGIALIGVFPISLAIFSVFQALPELVFEWYFLAKSPLSWKYIVGFFVGIILFSLYLYINFFRDKEFTEIKFKLVFPSALVLVSIRWVPIILDREISSGMENAFRGALYLLFFLLLAYIVKYRKEKTVSNLPDSQKKITYYTDSRVEKLADSLSHYIENSPEMLFIKWVRNNFTVLFSFLYFSLAISIGAFIAEKYVLEEFSSLIKLYTLAMVVLILIFLSFYEKIMRLFYTEIDYWRKNYSGIMEPNLDINENTLEESNSLEKDN